jgi:ABC-type Fe3+-siderophore transport system permease subunit
MNALRRALYVEAAVWAFAGLALSITPGFVLVRLFDQPKTDPAWLRIVGIQAFVLAMLMVLVAHRIEDLWWWSWAFALATIGVAAVVVLNAAIGLTPGQPALFWWLFSAVAIASALGLLAGLFISSQEQPLPEL